MTSSDNRQSIFAEELAIEQAHVDRVYTQLAAAEKAAKKAHEAGVNIFKTDRADFLREENHTALFERDAFTYQASKRLAMLNAEHEGLVFGRLDMTPAETRHIGRIGVRDDDYEPLVIDWRAPAAEPFYRATASDPMNVVRRRVLRCRDDVVIGIEDDLLDADANSDLVVVGEGALMAALTRARGHAMRDIVATIQAEQDEAIRAPYQGVTVIAGGPGTGKTVVALHRAAYLLYTHRARLERGGVMVIGPSPVFMNYIERVLPSLGEDSVTLHAIGEVASDVLRTSSSHLDTAQASVLKGSLRILPVLRRLVQAPLYAVEQGRPLTVTVKGEVLTLGGAELAAIRRSVLSGHLVNKSRSLAETAVISALWAKLSDDISIDRNDFDEYVSGHPGFTSFLNAWWPTLSPFTLLARLADPAELAAINRGAFTEVEQAELSASYRRVADELAAEVAGPKASWTVADIALLDELAALVGPPPASTEIDAVTFLDDSSDIGELVTVADKLTHVRDEDAEGEPQNTYAHVLVDEAQDITPMQWRMLRRRGPQASWTLVGDPAQSWYPDGDEVQLALRELMGSAPHRDFTLTKNYRSPKEVFDLAARVITAEYPDADLPDAVRSTGLAPQLLTATPEALPTKIDVIITRMASDYDGTIGVICPPSTADSLRENLAGLPGIDAAGERVVVLNALQSKGLEYDAVIVVDPDGIVAEIPNGTRVLYVALTRPTQHLVTIDIDTGGGQPAWRGTLDQS